MEFLNLSETYPAFLAKRKRDAAFYTLTLSFVRRKAIQYRLLDLIICLLMNIHCIYLKFPMYIDEKCTKKQK